MTPELITTREAAERYRVLPLTIIELAKPGNSKPLKSATCGASTEPALRLILNPAQPNQNPMAKLKELGNRISKEEKDRIMDEFRATLLDFCEGVIPNGSRRGDEWDCSDIFNSERSNEATATKAVVVSI